VRTSRSPELADAAAGDASWFGHRLPVAEDDETLVARWTAAEQAIRAAIASRFPDDAVLGEEEAPREGRAFGDG
jgi:fructose-1,6-bisphosphatase/inositol monophosphatase family enzyme